VEPEYSDELARLDTAIVGYVEQAMAQAIAGGRNIDAEWDGCLKQLNDLGIPRYQEIHQKAYTRPYGT
jgi:putative aldouronate transport system substrate-binding protein